MKTFDWSKLKSDVQQAETKKGYEPDKRFWKPTRNEKGTGLAIIRFIPDPNMEVWAKFYSHNFEYLADGQKKFWIKNCINTFGYDQECPICKKNQEYWNSPYEEDKKIASKRKRKLNFISNVYIVKDPANPENEGKVLLYQFGQKIYDKIKRHLFPSDEDKMDPDFKEFVPFDPFEGADFKLKIKTQGDFPNYDDSEFSAQSPLAGGDEKKIKAILAQAIDLSEFTDQKNFPTNDEVIQKLGSLLGITASAKQKSSGDRIVEDSPSTDSDDLPFDMSTGDAEPSTSGGNSLDDDLKFFEDL